MRKPARVSSLPTRSSSKTCRSRRLRNKLHQTLPEMVRRPRFQCDTCNKHFSRQQSLNKHRDKLHPSNGMKCELCGACFRNRSSIVKHIQTHAKTPVCFCTLCNETFTEFKALDKHVKVCRRSRRKMEVSAVVEQSDSHRKGNSTSVGYRGITTRSKRIAKTTVERLIEESSDCHVTELVEIDDEEGRSTLKGDGKSGTSLHRPTKPFDSECTHECKDTEFVCEVCGIKFVDDKGLSEHHHDELATEIIIEKATDGDICEVIDDFWKNRFWNSDRSLVYMKDQDSDDLNNVNQGDEIDEFPALVAGSIIHQTSSNPTPSLSEEYPPSSDEHQDACYELTKVNGNDSNKDGAHVSKSFNYGTSFGFGYPVTSSASIVISDTAGHSMSLGAVYYECIGTEFKTFTTRGLETENSSDGVATAGFGPVTQTPAIQAESLDDKMDFLSSFVNSPDVTMTNVRENSPLDECTVAAATPEEVPIGDKWFVCGQCSEQFETKSDLEVHIELFDHGGDLCFTEISYKASGAPCSSAGVGAAACDQNDDNKLKESPKNDGVSSITTLGYPNFGNLSDLVYGDSPYSILTKVENNICSYCGKALPSFDLLMSHLNQCHNMFTSQTDLDDHAKHHTKKKECHICGKMLEPPLLKDHIRSHDPPEEVRIQHRKCDLCSKRFDSMQSLASHQYLKHVLPAGGGTGSEVSYTCPHCRQQMQSKDVFIAHVASHTGVFPFECSECKQGFLYQSVLKTHINKTHVKTTLKYRCKDCDKNFNTPRLLQRHRRKPFDCGECKKVFYCREMYKKHMKEHKCKAPYRCDLCCKTFTVMRNWVAHQQVHNDME